MPQGGPRVAPLPDGVQLTESRQLLLEARQPRSPPTAAREPVCSIALRAPAPPSQHPRTQPAAARRAQADALRNPFGVAARLDLSSRLKLERIRIQLLRQEDSIIFGWMKRSAYRRNAPCYAPGGMVALMGAAGGDPKASSLSLLAWHLEQTEHCHARIRRYTSPDEHPFFPGSLPEPVLPALTYGSSPLPRYADEININADVMALYLGEVLGAITEEGDDNTYGSSVLNDVACLQALSKRIHFGKFVAEAKFRESRHAFEPLIRAADAEAIMALLTFPQQEAAVCARVGRKAALFGESMADVGGAASAQDGAALSRVTPEAVSRLWMDCVMPLTKRVQVMYLLRRLEASELEPGRFADGQARGTGPVGGFM